MSQHFIVSTASAKPKSKISQYIFNSCLFLFQYNLKFRLQVQNKGNIIIELYYTFVNVYKCSVIVSNRIREQRVKSQLG